MSDDIFNQIGKIIAKKGCSGVSKDAAEWVTLLSNPERVTPAAPVSRRQEPLQTAQKTEQEVFRQPAPSPLPTIEKHPIVSSAPVQINADNLNTLRQCVMNCRMCQLAETRKNIVFGEGNPHARLMFIGEAPGADEDETGRPFVGKAGQLLNKMINAMQETKQTRSTGSVD